MSETSTVPRWLRAALLGAAFLVAGAGIVFELVAGAVSSYLLGDAITRFSLVIGVFLAAMGVGSWLAKFIGRPLLGLLRLELAVALIGGLASPALYALNCYLPQLFELLFYTLVGSLGAMIGAEIPILVRILHRAEGHPDEAVSEILAFDYLGALAGSLLFPFVVLPFLGLIRASVVFGLANLLVAIFAWTLIKPRRRFEAVAGLLIAGILIVALAGSTRLLSFFEAKLYQDEVVFSASSRYQRVILTRWRDDVRLFLNGHLQFSSIDEARYHEALVLPALAAAHRPRTALILGGGDGLAAKRLLDHPAMESITIVDLDPLITELFAEREELLAFNEGSLLDPRVEVVNGDAMRLVEAESRLFDLIVIDLPDPSSPELARLYSPSFHQLALRRLARGGVLVTQASSPFYAREAYWAIVASLETAMSRTLEGQGTVLPYRFTVPSFGEWGFVLAALHPIDPESLRLSIPAEVLSDELLPSLFVLPGDLSRPEGLEGQVMDQPTLHLLYKKGWDRFNM